MIFKVIRCCFFPPPGFHSEFFITHTIWLLCKPSTHFFMLFSSRNSSSIKCMPSCLGNKQINHICSGGNFFTFPRSFLAHFTDLLVDFVCSNLALINNV